MRLTSKQRERILRELEALDHGRVIVTVGDRGYIEITVERRLRVREKDTPLDNDLAHVDTIPR